MSTIAGIAKIGILLTLAIVIVKLSFTTLRLIGTVFGVGAAKVERRGLIEKTCILGLAAILLFLLWMIAKAVF